MLNWVNYLFICIQKLNFILQISYLDWLYSMEWIKVEHVDSFVGEGGAEYCQLLLLEAACLSGYGGATLVSTAVDHLLPLLLAVALPVLVHVAGAARMGALCQSIFGPRLAAGCCSDASPSRLLQSSIEIDFEFLRVAPWALLLVKHIQSHLKLRRFFAWCST